MARKKASLKGKGVDILLGGSTGAEPEGELAAPAVSVPAQPAVSEPAQPPATPPTGVLAASRPVAKWPAPAQPVASAPLPSPLAESPGLFANPFAEPPATPLLPADVALAGPAFEAEAARGQPSAPVVTSLPLEETTIPVAEAPVSPPVPGLAGAPAAAQAGSGGPVSVPLPDDPRLLKKVPFGGLLDMSTPMVPHPETFEPPVQGSHQDFKLVPISETPMRVSDAEVARRVGDRANRLWARIDKLYEQVAEGGITDPAKTSEALSHLRIARDKELEDPRQFDEAEYLVNIVQYMVTRAGQVRQWGSTYGVVVLIYGLFALAIFGAGLVLDGLSLLMNWLRPGLPADFTSVKHVSDVFPLYSTILWGGVGGVLGLIYSLLKHAAIEQDFDRQYMLWYFGQPFLGMLMGVIVSLFLLAGVFLVDATGPAVQALGALLAIATAFRQNFVYAWLESLLRGFERRATVRDATAEASKPVSQPTTPAAVPAGEVQESPAGVG